ACNAFLAGDGALHLRETAAMLGEIKRRLAESGWTVVPDEPLKLTVNASARGLNGLYIADCLRSHGIEPEYAEPDYIVLMVTPATKRCELDAVVAALDELLPECTSPREPYDLFVRPERVMSPREAILSLSEEVTAEAALGRVCAAPTVGCPPAVPIVVSGERIDEACVKAMKYYGIERVRVL
ncbi:MAG: amino acid decarboxylase, partial [Oscillospiraceae bacterium]|nr:amino acid decarboxylase [Oscillospiraceae bacterium]